MCMVWLCYCFVDGRFKKCINVYLKKVKLIIHDCLTIVMLLYVMLYIVLAYLMLPAAITNAVCLHNASFSFSLLSLICANAFYFLAFSLLISFFSFLFF